MALSLAQVVGDRTGPMIALAILGAFTLVGLYFLVRTRMDEGQGAYETEATYILGMGENPALVEVPEDRKIQATATPLGLGGLKDLVALAERHGDLGVAFLLRASGQKDPFELSETIPDDTVEVELTASRGRVWIDVDGHVRAKPSLDDAVREDLTKLLLEIVDPDEARADAR